MLHGILHGLAYRAIHGDVFDWCAQDILNGIVHSAAVTRPRPLLIV